MTDIFDQTWGYVHARTEFNVSQKLNNLLQKNVNSFILLICFALFLRSGGSRGSDKDKTSPQHTHTL